MSNNVVHNRWKEKTPVQKNRWKDKEYQNYIKRGNNALFLKYKNPKTNLPISVEEAEQFSNLLVGTTSISGNPYNWLKNILEGLTEVEFPELPMDENLTANWRKMFITWFFETRPDFENANWEGISKTIFNSDSDYSIDISKSNSFIDKKNKHCIKAQFFEHDDSERLNPFKARFAFNGPDSGKKDYYSLVEWFIGSYDAKIDWEKKADGSYKIKAVLTNQSSWYSGTRLPKTWQKKIKEKFGIEMKNLVDSAPRGTTIMRKLNPLIILALLIILKRPIPSFGGNWDQEFHIVTQW